MLNVVIGLLKISLCFLILIFIHVIHHIFKSKSPIQLWLAQLIQFNHIFVCLQHDTNDDNYLFTHYLDFYSVGVFRAEECHSHI